MYEHALAKMKRQPVGQVRPADLWPETVSTKPVEAPAVAESSEPSVLALGL